VSAQSIRQPSAVAPALMSLGALALVAVHVVSFGVARETDEGAAARIFQLLMVAQVPVVAYFAIRWLPREPRPAMLVLALQACAALVPIAAILVLEQGFAGP
jgi:hypothetical protein